MTLVVPCRLKRLTPRSIRDQLNFRETVWSTSPWLSFHVIYHWLRLMHESARRFKKLAFAHKVFFTGMVILEWVAISFSRGSSWPRIRPHISCISCFGRQVLYHWATQGSTPGLWQSIYYKKYCLKYLSQSQEVCNGLVQTEEAGGHLSPSSVLDV